MTGPKWPGIWAVSFPPWGLFPPGGGCCQPMPPCGCCGCCQAFPGCCQGACCCCHWGCCPWPGDGGCP
ncbi:hypothetical protein ACFQY7_55285 [Actinomadura luteofluorescens]|uniref:hypothetical protein n=1 Tax=Actinomadura luteofluorescens TaxID=46163 RepID=UPI00362F56FB